MLKTKLFALTLFISFLSVLNTNAASTWTGASGTSWTASGNWSGGVPTATTDVIIPATTNKPTISGSAVTINSLTITGTTTLTLSAALTVSNALNVNGNFTIQGGSLLKAGSVTVTGFTLNINTPLTSVQSITTNGSTVTSNSAGVINTFGLNMTASTITLNGAITSTDAVQVPSPGSTTNTTLTTNATGNNFSAGVYVHTGSNLIWNGSGTTTCTTGDVSSGQTLTIGAGNTVTFTANISLHGQSPLVGMLVNNGTINTTQSISSDNINTNPSPAVNAVTNGTTGVMNLTTVNSQISLGSYTNLSNSGKINITNGKIGTANPSTVLNNTTGTITLTSGALNMVGGSTLTNSGAITLNTSSTLTADNPTTITNNSGASIVLNTSSTANFNGSSVSNINNSGTIQGFTNSIINLSNPRTITNSSTGSVQIDASTLNIAAGTSIINSGIVSAVSNSTINLSGNPAAITNQSGTVTTTSTAINMAAGSTISNAGGAITMTNTTLTGTGNPNTLTNTSGTWVIDDTDFIFNGTGKLTNSGTFTAKGASTINMTSLSASSNITNTGTFYAGLTNNSSCIITLDGNQPKLTNNSPGVFYLGSTSIIYPTSTSCLMTNSTGATFTLQSDVYGSAAIGPVPVGANPSPSLVGTYNVERYFQGSTTFDAVKNKYAERGYRIISPPVNTNNVISLNYIVGSTAGQTTGANSATNAFVTGAVGGSTSAGNPTLYLYRENKAPSNATFTSGNFIGITNITSPTNLTTTDGSGYSITVGNGIFFFYRGAATNWNTRTQAFPYMAPESVTLTSTGTLNQGSITVKDWYTPASSNLGMTNTAGNASIRGFNMVGNPYPCTIDWDNVNTGGIVATQLDPSMYVFNPVTYQYESYSYSTHTGNPATRTGKIASGQGFFVRALSTATAPALKFNETAKSPTSQLTGTDLLMGTPAKQAKIQLLRLKMVADSLNYDDIVVGFSASATTKYDGYEDSRDLGGMGALEGLTAYSSDGVPLAADILPLPKAKPLVIQLGVTSNASRRYTMQRPVLDSIPKIYEVWLMDKFKKDSLDLRHNDSYVFDINIADTASYGDNRFTLVIRQNPALNIHLLSFTGTKAAGGSQIEWKTENEEAYTNFTVERSTDNGLTFDVMGGFASNGQGTYTLLDKSPVNNATNIYRLKIEDLNGTISYSKAVSLIYGTETNSVAAANTINVYPNPAVNTINLAIKTNAPSNLISGVQSVGTASKVSNQSYAIKIVNVSGNVVKTAMSSQPTWQDDVATLLPGTYIIQVINNSDKSVVGKTTFIKI